MDSAHGRTSPLAERNKKWLIAEICIIVANLVFVAAALILWLAE